MVVKAGVADPSRNPDFTPVACTAYTATLRGNPELWTLAALAYAPAKRPAGTTGAASVIATINAAWRRDPAASGMVQRRTETLCAPFSALQVQKDLAAPERAVCRPYAPQRAFCQRKDRRKTGQSHLNSDAKIAGN